MGMNNKMGMGSNMMKPMGMNTGVMGGMSNPMNSANNVQNASTNQGI